MSEPAAPPSDADVLVALAQIEAEANARRDELRRIAAALPAAISRRSMLRSLGGDLLHAPNKGDIIRRAVAKLGRAPAAAIKRLRSRSRA